ncbi:protein translocase SEC61 complex subunit gamma [Candidatus Geothermarchaeota archaeon]|nr:MAG: protein translocase SEC61 complex subunit gamma [Candidatus Geothermarchaeota archaeon]
MLSKKPDVEDFKQSLKLVLLGFTIIGLVGLAIHLLFTFIRGLM